ncbi:hypothetical protein TRIUR3_04167 [Triticum urartu]|uniref:Uncharacterized protein n=1 Tax=Triticum urartu TaxID=4572 RepID=M7ZTM5_TRIUA|nr:hypothetical protein TRIUR3_04167 [Triticum urartu]
MARQAPLLRLGGSTVAAVDGVLEVSGCDTGYLLLDLAGTLAGDWQEGVGLTLPDLVAGVAEMAGLGCFRRKPSADIVDNYDGDVLGRRFPS